jgi:hypothetical protein
MEIDEALVTQFSAITDAPKRKAETYLRVSDMNLEQAIQLYFETGGVDMDIPPSSSTPTAPPLPARPVTGAGDELIEIDDDVDDDMREALVASGGGSSDPTNGGTAAGSAAYDDEALARQLQQEFYEGGSGESNGVRAPMARTVETLVDEDDYYSDPRRRASARRGGMLF